MDKESEKQYLLFTTQICISHLNFINEKLVLVQAFFFNSCFQFSVKAISVAASREEVKTVVVIAKAYNRSITCTHVFHN